MSVRLRPGGPLVLAAVIGFGATIAAQADWTIPDDAVAMAGPPVTPEMVKHGADLFQRRCRRCHGPEGKGNGPYSDPEHPAADLTDPDVGRTPDGVLFYKIWNGKRPMPAFKRDYEAGDIWALVAYVRTLGADAGAARAE